ncbi:MAG TPA: type II toxin-antitoxin system Phd/YefM family antitoxin [Candidatus Limnocylindrales bacterium]|nr:type II toxin-antitoxin system Phd/YefM family antitoxin [Candidatus Limnocylindrales bacterium]
MRVVTPTDMRKRLGEILDAASAGERILIERDHKPIAWLVSPEDGRRFDEDEQARIERSLAALDRLREFSIEMAAKYPPPDDGLTEAEWLAQERERRADHIEEAVRSIGRPTDE